MALLPQFNPIIQNFDAQVMSLLNTSRLQSLDGFFKIITESAGIVAFGVPAALLIIALIKHNVKLRKISIYMASSAITCAIISNILKHSIGRVRPFILYDYVEKLSSGGSPSFPSGHTADAFVFATALILVHPKWYTIAAAVTWATLAGYSRIHLGVHYPTDVIAGAILGALSALLIKKAFTKYGLFQRL